MEWDKVIYYSTNPRVGKGGLTLYVAKAERIFNGKNTDSPGVAFPDLQPRSRGMHRWIKESFLGKLGGDSRCFI